MVVKHGWSCLQQRKWITVGCGTWKGEVLPWWVEAFDDHLGEETVRDDLENEDDHEDDLIDDVEDDVDDFGED